MALAVLVCAAQTTTLTWGQIKRGVNIIPQKIASRTWGVVRINPEAEVLPLLRQEVKEEGKTIYTLLSDLKTREVEPIFISTTLGDMVVGFKGKVEFDTRIEHPSRYLLVYVRKGMTEYRAWEDALDEPLPVSEIVWVAVLVGVRHFDPTLRLDGVKWKEL